MAVLLSKPAGHALDLVTERLVTLDLGHGCLAADLEAQSIMGGVYW